MAANSKFCGWRHFDRSGKELSWRFSLNRFWIDMEQHECPVTVWLRMASRLLSRWRIICRILEFDLPFN
jgi:hypothetical protein